MLTKKSVIDILSKRFVCPIVTTKQLAESLKVSQIAIRKARLSGKLKAVDRNCFDLDAVAEWLYANPRFLTKINDMTITEPKG